MTTARIELPPKLIPVFTGEARYRGAYGGRGSAKTRSFAKMSAVKIYQWANEGREGIFLCAREFMNSLDDSSMEEIKAAIQSEDWLNDFFEIGEKYIRTKCGRIAYKFAGLNRNIESLKSKARILGCWVDEGEAVSEGAWRKLIPTVREDGSEIWVTWNPDKDDSATHLRFRVNPPAGARIVEMNYTDNPWFPAVLEAERLEDLRHRPDDYAHVWEGGFKTNSEAQVFKNWTSEEFETPHDAVHRFGADWGFAIDPTVLVRCHVEGRKLYVDQEVWEVGCEIDKTPALFDRIEGSRKWLIRADSARPETVSYMKRQGFRITAAIKGQGSIEDGIEFLRSFDIIVHPRCAKVIRELSLYSYKIDKDTEEVLPVLEDKNNHTIDALRYALEELRRTGYKPKEAPAAGPRDRWARASARQSAREEGGINWKTM
jgi:phage terminase large subunit